MIRDTSNIDLIRAVGYGDSEIVTQDHGITTLTQLRKARQVIADYRNSMPARRAAADLLQASPYRDDRELAEGYIGMWQCKAYRKDNAFAKLNKGTLRRDALDDVRGNAFTWLAVAFVLLCAVLTMPHGIADVLPNAIAEAQQ